ncbi:MAG: Nicotinate-nucleotide--dimethylbenzimidazole phosphoribosyltransferase [uncultured Thermomicrobiales bacterium]|uniref:Nicotinate-nucleotide--dimethylbenzimidazole phosphoribosyltransferase n=1 Tax=uncultured Thermomicrobiales bacterium TaxID=1645740 RepID=A0A6J4VSF1_9BACT|nr:MAG: Nicotinate-nucleotide--dimethylbenzimidazole phosphoribosyltransferase [uncultured Thermomicrobiales bacterium]
MNRIEEVIARIGPPDAAAMARARAREGVLTKPPGSLGRLEALAIGLAGILGTERPELRRKAIVIMAGDHGVTAEGVSAYPAAVTTQMVANFLAGGAAINALARSVGARVTVVDMGVAGEIAAPPASASPADRPIARPTLLRRAIGRGTANAAHGPAMGREDAIRAVEATIAVAGEEVARGLDLLGVGEMGIGNTTAASAIVAALTGEPPAIVTGRGTGVDGLALRRKVGVVRQMLAINRPDPSDPLDVLAKVGGFEIAGLVGLILGAAAARVPIVLDGFITGAAALVAVGLCPTLTPYLFAAHRSTEPGHAVVLERLGLDPLLDLGLRLGEGSGAALALGLLDGAARHLAEMATFAEAGVSDGGA